MSLRHGTRSGAPPAASSPFTSRGFRLLWFARFVSFAGDQFFPIAIVALALDDPNPGSSIGVVFAARFGALALFIVLGGVLADRFDRRALMILLDVVRAVAVVTIIALGSDAPLTLLAVVTFVLGAGEAVFQPVMQAMIPQVVAEEQLKRANAASNVLQSSARVVGPALAGVVVASLGAMAALWIDLVTFFVSAAALALMTHRDVRPLQADESPEKTSMLSSAIEGIQVVLRLRWLAALEVMAIVHTLLAVGPWSVLLPLFAESELGGIDGYGMLLAVFFAGGIPGATLAGRLNLARPGAWGLLGIGSFGLALGGMALSAPLPILMVVFVVGGFGTQFFAVLKITAIQEQVDDRALGRVFSLDFFASFVTMPLGQLAAGALVTSANLSTLLWGAAGVIVVTTPLVLLVRGVTRLTDEASALPRPVPETG